MEFAIILVCTIVACFLLRNPIKKSPALFYALAIIIDIVFITGTFIAIPHALWRVFFILIQKCTLALALFIVVMFIGVLPRNSKACIWLKPIRAELSIIAWILSLGHMAVYLESYIPKIFSGA
ncbi:MAG: hypothetical protein HGA54_05305, partial [Actinobacteria bacterium]|nr:hypothetical protein [Actinomycetota bacterium]